jgi:hypothetical protein
MSRFLSVILAAALYGCAAPASGAGPLISPSQATPSAFAGDPAGLAAPPQAWQLAFDPVELMGDQVDFPAHRLLPSDEPPPAAAQEDRTQTVLGLLREFVAPGKWNAEGLKVQDGLLSTRQSPGILRALQGALKTLKDNRGRMIRTRFRGFALPTDGLVRFENIPPVGGGLAGTFDQRILLDALRDADPNGGFTAPMDVTTFHGQKSNLMILSQKAYVSGYEPGQGAYDPQLTIASEGVVAELRSIANGDRPREFLLSFEIQLASPTELVSVQLGSGFLQMPAQGYARLSGRCTLRPDQALLLVTRNPDVRKTDRPLLAMVITLDWAE